MQHYNHNSSQHQWHYVGHSIHQVFSQQAQLTPAAIAILLPNLQTHTAQHLTYQELDQQSHTLARLLQHKGVKPGDIVALASQRSLERMIALLAILKAGAAYLPLDLNYPAQRLALMVQEAQPRLLIHQSPLNSTLDQDVPAQSAATVPSTLRSTLADLGCPVLTLDPDWLAHLPTLQEFQAVSSTPEDLAYINYTSGSTGQPKGVMIPHRGVLRLVLGNTYATFGPTTRFLHLAPLSFDAATFEIWGALLNGGCCVVYPEDSSLEFQALGTILASHQVTTLWLTASLFNTVISEAPDILTPVRELLTGGEALSVFHVREALKHLPQTQLINGYGPTESTTFTCCYRIPPHLPPDLDSIPIGSAIADTEVYVLDAELIPVPYGEPGELYIGGAGLAVGYQHRPDLTAERFLPNPSNPGQTLYRTGDRVRRLPDGNLAFLGRLDDQVKLRGYRIELAEIEQVLRRHPDVSAAVVIVREDQPADRTLVAYVTTADAARVDDAGLETSLLTDLRSQVPDYMIPAQVVRLASFPLTPNGKVDRRALPRPERFSGGNSGGNSRGNSGSNSEGNSGQSQEPETENQCPDNRAMCHSALAQAITQVWQDVLGLNPIGLDETFEDLGGTSLKALQITHRLQVQLGQPVQTVQLYAAPTIRQFADLISTALVPHTPTSPSPTLHTSDSETLDIAIIGMVGRFPGANSVEEFWQNLCTGIDSITVFTDDQLDPSVPQSLRQHPDYIRHRGVLTGAETLDAAFFGLTPREAEIMDPQARVLLELAYEALETVGYFPNASTGNIGLFAGSSQNTYFAKHLCGRSDLAETIDDFQLRLANEKDFLTSRISYKLNLTGPSVTVSTACSTSLVAVVQAAESLRNDQCRLALAGGVAIHTPQAQGYLYQEGSIVSADGYCRPFDAQANGTVFSNGAGLVVLKRLQDAQQDCDRIYAVIKGYGLNNDGSAKVSFTAPSIPGQVAAIQEAQLRSGFHPESIAYIEAHGTATPIGDPIEVEALRQAFQPLTTARQFCALGSLKGNVGHMDAAAGIAGLIKTALALYHRKIPPTLHYQTPNPEIDFANSPFYVNTEVQDWPGSPTERPRAGVSALGVGGTNAHVLLEATSGLPALQSHPTNHPEQLLIWSAKTPTALVQITQRLHAFLAQNPDVALVDIAYTLQVGRPTYAYRHWIAASSHNDAQAQITALLQTPPPQRAYPPSPVAPPVVFMFPGQGSQSLRMGAELYTHAPVFRQAVDACAELLQPRLCFDLREMLYPPSDAEIPHNRSLYHTPNTQIALFVVEYALAKLWQSWGILASAYIGHSIGEFVAACLAGVFSLADALTLVTARGALMEGLPAGAMMAVSLSSENVAAQLQEGGVLPGRVTIAAVNSPLSTVVSGSVEAIETLQDQLQAQDIACRRLHTAHAFHSPMMQDRVAPLAWVVETMTLHPPQTPLLSTVTGTWMTATEATNPQYWANHLVAPVQFAAGVAALRQAGLPVFLEIGPRSTLTTLVRQQFPQSPLPSSSPSDQTWAIASLAGAKTPDQEWRSLLLAIAELGLAGVTPDWSKFYAGESRQRVCLPTYPFQRQRYWIDPKPLTSEFSMERQDTDQNHSPQTQADQAGSHPQSSFLCHPQGLTATPSTRNGSGPETRYRQLWLSLRTILQEVSGIAADQIDCHASFFELGLDSLSLTQLALVLKRKLKLKVTFRQLLEEVTTLEALAEFADQTLPTVTMTPLKPFEDSKANACTNSALTRMEAKDAMEASRVGTPAQRIVPPVVPITIPDASLQDFTPRSNLEQIVQQQLQLMARQLELLGYSGTSVPSSAAQPPSTAPAPRTRIERHSDNTLTAAQQTYLDQLIQRYTQKTIGSKSQTQQHRRYLADPRSVSGFSPQLKEMVYPIVTERSSGSRVWDVDGNEYLDLVNGFGLNFFGWSPDFITTALQQQLQKGCEIGPQHPLVGEVAQKISQMTGHERVVFCNTGSEAVMAALRLARTVTGRSQIALFSGAYHGTFDQVVIRASASQQGMPGAPGILPSMTENTLVLDYGTPESLEILRQRADDLAAILVEPVQSRRPELQPHAFLQDLRRLTQDSETALIFDEVVTGFRVHPGGAQAHFGIQADLATYGKIIGGGMPIGILAGHATYMDALDGGYWQYGDDSIPEVGVTFFAGTFVRHPLAIAAAHAVLLQLEAGGPDLQRSLSAKVERFVLDLQQFITSVQAPIHIHHFSSFFYIDYPPGTSGGPLLFYLLREKGIHIWEHRPCFFTLAHRDTDIEHLSYIFKASITELQAVGFLTTAPDAPTSSRAFPTTSGHPAPHPQARMGRDLDGNPAWYIPDPERLGKYLQLATP